MLSAISLSAGTVSLSLSFFRCHHIRQTFSDHLYQVETTSPDTCSFTLLFPLLAVMIIGTDTRSVSDFLNPSCGCSSSLVEVGCSHVPCSLLCCVRGRAVCGFQEEATAAFKALSLSPADIGRAHMVLLQAPGPQGEGARAEPRLPCSEHSLLFFSH